MSTRGIVGFVVDGQEKIAYNHSDSYPGWLGLRVLEFLQRRLPDGFDQLVKQARALEVVNTEVPPTEEQKERLKPYADLSVSEQSLDDWYCLLRNTQGDLDVTLEAGAIADSSGSALESLYTEWGYVIDLDRRVLEVYRGFQTQRHDLGRWAGRPSEEEIAENQADVKRRHEAGELNDRQYEYFSSRPEYYSIALFEEFPFSDGLPTADEMTALEARAYPDDDSDD